MNHARVLVLEDDPLWLKNLEDELTRVAEYVACASTLAKAQELLETQYFNVAIVDLRLHQGDPKDTQGFEFVQLLQTLKLDETIRCVMLSAFGTVQRVTEAFRDFHVVDFLEKQDFTAEAVLNAVQQALTVNHLDREIEIEMTGGHDLLHLLERFAWAQREDPFQLRSEFCDLLRRLLGGADRLFIHDLPAGQSGAGILQVDPYYGLNAGTPVVVKFGKKDKICKEQDNYTQYVERYAGAFSSTQLRCAAGRAMGAICYHLVGTELQEVMSFGDFYRQHGVEQICAVLDQLLRQTTGRWYDNREQPRARRNLIELYEDGLNIKWNEVWAGAEATGVDMSRERLEFPGINGTFANPKRWLETRDYAVFLSAWRAFTHGDLNEHNILVTEDGRCWLIDFYRTGWGHILRDVAELETVIKFNLTEVESLDDYQRLEARLVEQTRLNRPVVVSSRHPCHKPLAVIGYLRSLADNFAGSNNTMAEYNLALMLTTLNLLRLEFMQDRHRAVLLSAAMLCERLGHTA
jgi:ActR/RegA family two-component response regulator